MQIFAERESKQRFSRANLNDCVSQKNKKKKKEKKKERRKKELFTQSQQIALSTLSSLPSIGDVTTTTVWDCKVTIIPYTSTNSRINNFDWTIFLFFFFFFFSYAFLLSLREEKFFIPDVLEYFLTRFYKNLRKTCKSFPFQRNSTFVFDIRILLYDFIIIPTFTRACLHIIRTEGQITRIKTPPILVRQIISSCNRR